MWRSPPSLAGLQLLAGAAGTGGAAGAAGVAVADEAAAVTGGYGGGVMGPSGGGVPARRGHRPSSPHWAITQW